LLVLIENSQGFKTFWVYLKALFENYLKSSIYFLKNFFEKEQVSKYYFRVFIQTYASMLAKEWNTDVFYLVKIVFQKLSLKGNFKHYFIKYYFPIFPKDLFSNPSSILLCKQSSFCQVYKVLLEIHILPWKPVSYCPTLIPWFLENICFWFEVIWVTNAKVMKQNRKRKGREEIKIWKRPRGALRPNRQS
jgi:hypothetical protein